MSTAAVKFRKQGHRYIVEQDGERIGVVWNNGARPSYLRHWTYRFPDGTEGRTGSRRGAADSLVQAAAKA